MGNGGWPSFAAKLVLAIASTACGRLQFDAVETCVECDEGGSGGPVNSGLAAPVLLFQPDYQSYAANRGGPIQRGGVNEAYSIGVYADPADGQTKLFVNDRMNNRVLVYDRIPQQSGALPDRVVGQLDFTSGLANAGQPTPNAIGMSDNVNVSVCRTGEMFVADASNHRVLVWRTVPTADGTPADFVLGQPDFTTAAAGTSSNRFNRPYAAHCIDNRLFVTDLFNHRILVYDPVPSSGDARPRFVIGQPDFDTGTPGCAPASLQYPYEVLHHDGHYYVADGGNHRVLVLDDGLALGPATPIAVLGQPDLSSCAPNRGTPGADATTLDFPNSVAARADVLVVNDHDNHRVLFFRLPVATGDAAEALLGQPSFAERAQLVPPSSTSFSYAKGLVLDGDFLWIGDGNNSRVLATRLPPL